ncbi:hypothetical protein [Mycobacterium sp. AZCC_0083]|uniref:hypothetical protein n=1 Tax=Mycobacterium sp. AZCC_0083 TaxID=2735882 RepID=UPI00161A0C44|nr:hypothetical protein [Mycobacterium sp. AZCC_0083]MBB5167101.1 hypothetical protein [Mycobacterium sp. AZCC_0083]
MATTLVPTGQDRKLAKLRIQELEEQLALERSLLADPIEPALNHAVIRFVKYDQKYTFAAIRAYTNAADGGIWFVTQDGSRSSRQGHAPKTWTELLAFIGERNWPNIEVLA